jgi:HK97 family phage prohead protease
VDNKLERRCCELKELRFGENDENHEPIIVGYASVFDSLSETLGGCFPFKEKVECGAFAESITKDDIRALFNHDPNYCLGRNIAGTLKLAEDEKGLYVAISPPKTAWANDLLESMKRGDITQMSFGFFVLEDEWSVEGDMDLRTLKKVKLFDVSPVTFPAYKATECNVRSGDEILKEHQDIENARKTKEKQEKTAQMTMKKQKFNLLKENQ